MRKKRYYKPKIKTSALRTKNLLRSNARYNASLEDSLLDIFHINVYASGCGCCTPCGAGCDR